MRVAFESGENIVGKEENPGLTFGEGSSKSGVVWYRVDSGMKAHSSVSSIQDLRTGGGGYNPQA